MEDKNYFEYFIKVLTGVLVINNIIGLVQFMYAPAVNDDAFIGFYGAGGLGPHTLSLVNFIVCAYYFLAYQHSKSKIKLFLFLFFISSAILSFYGLGLIIFILSIFIYKFSLKAFFRSIFIFVLVMVMFTGLLYTFRYQTFLYNYENLQRVALFFRNDDGQKNAHQIPRKLMLYRNYVEVYLREPILFLTGSGPGTFNSRSYFLLNGDYSKHKFVIELFGQHSPRYAQKYVYPLWNSTNTGKYMDGTRNQPFSSIVALFAEFGAIVSLFISMLASNKYRSTLQKLKQQNDQGSYSANLYFLKFLTIFFVLNLFTDNFLEYPEIVMIYLFIFKTIEIKIFNSSKHSTSLIK
ncbi:hypothetical protein [Chryseosolibacter indicus]|uniref:Oligosaccharide repeat unit polymerase n=1 Tax=Chryseosolibacter indicus TaxID=2782351 RepID=A0ABS5VUS8_9BACT|nr:hypothetical protein [Chryseosolibacter indicus]MBT1704572.1 hypothetical protein [Chryseosolibacter indicus]